jgi:hypothetical protein
MGNYRHRRRQVVRQLRWSDERKFSAPLFRYITYFFVIRGYDDVLEEAGLLGGTYRPSDHRSTAKVFNVFAQNALATAARGYDCDPHK